MIENLGIEVLPISMKVWDELMNHEKIPYIMRELKSKTTLKLTMDENII